MSLTKLLWRPVTRCNCRLRISSVTHKKVHGIWSFVMPLHGEKSRDTENKHSLVNLWWWHHCNIDSISLGPNWKSYILVQRSLQNAKFIGLKCPLCSYIRNFQKSTVQCWVTYIHFFDAMTIHFERNFWSYYKNSVIVFNLQKKVMRFAKQTHEKTTCQ